MHDSTRVDDGKKKLKSSRDNMEACSVVIVGRGEEGLLCDTGSELRKGRNGRSRVKAIDGMGKRKKKI